MPHLENAKSFIERINNLNEYIYYSDIVLREIKNKLMDDIVFLEKLNVMKNTPNFRYIEAIKEDFAYSRKLESKSQFEISFYDCIHISICKRLDLILVTRDKKLLEFSKEFIISEKPENLPH